MPPRSPRRARAVPAAEAHQAAFLDAARSSRAQHQPWTSPPDDAPGFAAWLQRSESEDFQGFVIERIEDGAFAGVVSASQISRGALCSAYLGYWGAAALSGRGYMTEGLACALDQLLGPAGLHRVEANIQPGNRASINLVKRLGFVKEGFSRGYLHIDGAWRDHERWAITQERWERARGRVPLPDPLQIVRLGPGEEARLRAVRLQALLDAPDAFGSTFDETVTRPPESWTQQLADLPTFVATLQGRDVGMVRVGLDRDDPERAWLISMWVAPQARGSGASDRLVRAIIDWTRQSGRSRLLLDVADQNPRAIALYARHGFEPEGWTGALPAPRQHITEHRRALRLD